MVRLLYSVKPSEIFRVCLTILDLNVGKDSVLFIAIEPKVGGPQISSTNRKNPQVGNSNNFFRFADLPQMWHLAYFRFADTIFFVIGKFLDLRTLTLLQIYTLAPYIYILFLLLNVAYYAVLQIIMLKRRLLVQV
jgi:hypothetical protein